MRAATSADVVKVFLVAAEPSGDRLAAALMRALRVQTNGQVRFQGIGGTEMTSEGLASLHPIDDLSIIGFTAIPRLIPRILRLMRFTVRQVVQSRPDVLVLVDSPGLTRSIASRVRAADPKIPIVTYVSPTVWAWRPGRARAMRPYIDHVLAVLPFEPEVHRRLGGPPCTYVGHPLTEEVHLLRSEGQEKSRRLEGRPLLLVFPGSRTSEVRRLLAIFGQTLALLCSRVGQLEVVVPTLPYLAESIRQVAEGWPLSPRIVTDRAEKQAAFRDARAALAKSGTVTLELALAGVPMVAAYKVSPIDYLMVGRRIRKRLPSIILPNLLLGENVVPELLQDQCTAENLADALLPLLAQTSERQKQVAAFARLNAIMEIGSGRPGKRAAEIVLGAALGGRVS